VRIITGRRSARAAYFTHHIPWRKQMKLLATAFAILFALSVGGTAAMAGSDKHDSDHYKKHEQHADHDKNKDSDRKDKNKDDDEHDDKDHNKSDD